MKAQHLAQDLKIGTTIILDYGIAGMDKATVVEVHPKADPAYAKVVVDGGARDGKGTHIHGWSTEKGIGWRVKTTEVVDELDHICMKASEQVTSHMSSEEAKMAARDAARWTLGYMNGRCEPNLKELDRIMADVHKALTTDCRIELRDELRNAYYAYKERLL